MAKPLVDSTQALASQPTVTTYVMPGLATWQKLPTSERQASTTISRRRVSWLAWRCRSIPRAKGPNCRSSNKRRRAPSASAVTLFEQALRQDGRLCLGLMLTVERNSLPDEVMNEVRLFVDQHTAWLASAWDLGRSDLTVQSDLPGAAAGPVLFSALEGMMAFALLRPNPEAVFPTQATALFAALGVKA
jgi:hypothetical protein